MSNELALLFLFLISTVITLFFGNPLIKLLQSLSFEQTIRKDGPKEHIAKKSQTPTIGGVIFLIPLFFITLLIYFLKNNFFTLDLLIVIGSTFLLSLLGFIDDYLKVIKKHNKGISGWTKLFIQFLLSLVIYQIYKDGLSYIYLLWLFFIIAGASNSYNLTDGLDGLVVSVSLCSFVGFSFLAYMQGKYELLAFSIVFIGTLLGFLYFNKHPAKVFMGDTGSLAIGGAIGAVAIALKSELYLIFFATIPILEALSVILQVVSCQLSKRFFGVDKRIFKMTPLHHHFELCGWKETKIVRKFTLLQAIFTLIGIIIAFMNR